MQRRNTDGDQSRRNARADRASPSTASVGSASSTSKNTNRVHDTSALTNRLKHLDDCMRQVKSLIRNLEKSDDPTAHQQLLTLQQMMHQLSIEQSNSDPRRARFNALDQQRHRHLNDRVEPGTHDFTLPPAHGLENSLDGDPAVDLLYAQQLQEEKEGLMQQNEIMRKIIESQKKLTALQEQHDHVLNIQKKAENKLAEAKALQDQLAVSNPDLNEWVTQMQREAAAGTLLLPPTTVVREPRRGGTPSSSSSSRRPQHPGGPPPTAAVVGAAPGGDSSGWAAWASNGSAADGASFEAAGAVGGGLPWEPSMGNLGIEHLERRVRQLQGVAAQQGKLGFAEREDAAVECEQAELQSSQLTDNIRALQEQKFHVDRLLSELTTLQSEASTLGLHGNLPTGGVNQVPKVDPALRAPPSKGSVPFEQLSSKEKRRQVNEMRKTLQQLQSAVKNLEPDVTHGAVASHPDAAPADLQEPEPRPSRVAYKKDNLQGDFPARRHYEAEGRANEEPDVVAGVATATAAQQQQPPPADLLASAQGKASGDVLADKVRQLQTTRNQLQYLQSLVASLQDDTADSVASAPGNSVPSGGEADPRKEQQQRRCLQQLQEQRLRLSLLRQHLAPGGGGGAQLPQPPAKNQMRVAPASGEAPQRLLPPPPQSTRLGGPSAEGLSPAKKDNLSPLPKNLYDPTKASNRSLEQQQASLNLEPSPGGGAGALNRDKAILEELLQQERSKQLLSYSHNEDVRSPSSCSASSGPTEDPGGSVMAGGNTTIAATWGGSSTQENLEDDEDDDEDRQEGSVGAGHDSEGSRSDFENDTSRVMPPPIPGRDHPHAAAESSPAPLGRVDNRFTHANLTRVVNGPYSRGSQSNRWQGGAGLLSTPILRQHSAGGHSEVTPPDDERATGGMVASQMMPALHQLSQQLHQQLETTNAIYQSILHEQQALGATAAAVSPGASVRVPSTDAVQHCAIQQQLLLSIIHCYQLLSIQQLEISQLQHATHQSYSPMVDESLGGAAALSSGDHGGSPFLLSTELTSAAWAQGPAPSGHQPPLHHNLPTEVRGAPPGATLNNQVVPGCRANNFWDNFRSYSRQNLLSNPGTAPKTNELPANFQVQQTHPSGPIPMATASRMKSWTSPRDPRGGPTSSVSTGASSRARQVRPVLNVWPQEPAGNRATDSKQANGTQSHLSSLDSVADAPSTSSLRQPSAAFQQQQQQQQQQQPACDMLKMSIGAEVSRLLEGKEDAASLAAVLRQLQLLNCPPQQPDLSLGQACGGARRKVPSSVKSNVPKENRALNGASHLVFQLGTSESSPDLVTSVEFSADSRTRTEETLSDSSFDKNTSRPLAAVTACKRAKPLCSSASQPPHLPTLRSSSLERSAPAEQMVAERDCDADEEQGATARPVEPAFEQTWPERDTTVSAPAVELPPPSVEGPAAEPLPGLDNMLLLAEVNVCLPRPPPLEAHALRGMNQDVQQAMYNFEMALLRQGLVADGEQQGEEAEDDEDREMETEPEAEGTQDLAEADQSPAAEQDAADQQPEDVAAPAVLLGAVGGAVGGAEGGAAEAPTDDSVARPAAAPQDEPEVSHEEAAAPPGGSNQSEESSTRQQDGAHPPNS